MTHALVISAALGAILLFLLAVASANTSLFAQHYPQLQRNLIYTGMTRGKRLVVLVGQKKALAIAVRAQRTTRRWSKLRHWLASEPIPNP